MRSHRRINRRQEIQNATNRYRVIGGKPSVELKLRTPRQLFDERDPAPFRERDLDDDAARYILTSYRELKEQRDVKLSLYFESFGEFRSRPWVIEDAIHAFFRFEAEVKRRELRDIFRQGLTSLAIGLTFLFTCTYFSKTFGGDHVSLWRSMMHEGLFIMGWVAMWRPISIFLYEWWPIREAMTTHQRLGAIEIEILPLGSEATKELRDGKYLGGANSQQSGSNSELLRFRRSWGVPRRGQSNDEVQGRRSTVNF